ncbi:MAG: PGF-CTERM sorting domain-containing protein [Haloglomus sp.]
MPLQQRFTAVLLALSVVAAAFVGGAAAASEGSIETNPNAPGESATHTVTVTVGDASAGSWNGLAVDYGDSGADASNVTGMDIQRIGVDEGDDDSGATIDREVGMSMERVATSENGSVLTVALDGSAAVDAGDEVVVVYASVINPMSGEWTVGLDIDPSSSGGTADATLSVGDSMDGTTPTPTMGDNETMSGDDSMSDDNSMSDNETMSGNDSMSDDDSMTDNETMSGNDSMSDDDSTAGDDSMSDDNSMSDNETMSGNNSMDGTTPTPTTSGNDAMAGDETATGTMDGGMTDESAENGSMTGTSTTMPDGESGDGSGGDETPASGGTESEGQPGFGAAIAVVALLGAALLAARRRGA